MKPFMALWRTALVVLALAVLLLVGYVIGLHSTNGSALFPAFATADVTLAAIAAGKSAVEHLAGNGGGIAGAAKALFTSAQPTQPGPEAQP